MSDIDEILNFDPTKQDRTAPPVTLTGSDEIDDILSFDPVGGTYEKMPVQKTMEQLPVAAQPPRAGYKPPERPHYEQAAEPEAEFSTIMKASLVDDPVTRVRIFAEGRGVPVAEIPQRYRITKKGDIEFKADNGKWQREIFEKPISKMKETAASIVAHPSTYLAPVGAAFGAVPGAVGGAVAGEAIRKGIGKYVYDEPQTAIDNLIDIGLEGLLALGGEMIGKVVTGTVNKYLGRKAGALKRAGQEITQNVLTPEDHAKALYIKSLADKFNITLAPHQLYDKEGMTNIWKYLRKHPLTSNRVQKFEKAIADNSDAAIDNFIQKMGGYEQTPVEVGKGLKEASEDAITYFERSREAAAKPYYDKAFDRTPVLDMDALRREYQRNAEELTRRSIREVPDVDSMVKELNGQGIPTMQVKGETRDDFVERITRDYKGVLEKEPPMIKSKVDESDISALKKRQGEILDVLERRSPGEGVELPMKSVTVNTVTARDEIDRLLSETVKGDPSYTALTRVKTMLAAASGDPRKLDRVKRSGIDNVLRKTKTDRTLKREMMLVKKKLTQAMDDQIPKGAYKKARERYGELSKPIDIIKDSVIGQLAEVEGDKALSKALNKLFTTSNMPDYMLLREARNIITSTSKDPKLWDKAVGSYVRDVYENLVVTEEGRVMNAVGKLQKRLFGSKRQQQIMAEAFGGSNTPEYKEFKNLMTVFQRASIGASRESMTAPFQAIERSFGATSGSKFYRLAKDTKASIVEGTLGWWNEALVSGRTEDVVTALTAPNVVSKLQQIKTLSPKSKRFWETFAVLTAMVSARIEPATPESQTPGQTRQP